MNKRILCAAAALLAATLACSIFVGGPSYPEGPAPAGSQSTQSLQDQLTQALAAATQTGVVSLDISEAQLNGFLAAELAKQQHPLLTDPRVYLRNGEMKVYGKATSGIFTANISLTMQASVDSEGKPQITVTQTDFGPLAAPQGLNEAASSLVQEAFTGWLGPVATGFRLEQINIGDGVMTVSGRLK